MFAMRFVKYKPLEKFQHATSGYHPRKPNAEEHSHPLFGTVNRRTSMRDSSVLLLGEQCGQRSRLNQVSSDRSS